jgi:hypothetical protein
MRQVHALPRPSRRVPQPCTIRDGVTGSQPIRSQKAAPASRRTVPRAKRARPGQLDFMPKPLAGLAGSRVALCSVERSRLTPLSRPRHSGWAAVSSTPPRTKKAPIHISTMLASARALCDDGAVRHASHAGSLQS